MTKQTVLHILVALWLYPSITHAQQLSLFAQHPEYHGLINAASVNANFLTGKENLSAGVSCRSQLENLVTTLGGRAEWIINKNIKRPTFVVGTYVQKDEIGMTQNLDAYGRVALIVPFGDIYNGGISVGFNGGYTGRTICEATPAAISPTFDDKIPLGNQQGFWDLGLGLFAYKRLSKKTQGQYVYGGVSMPRVKWEKTVDETYNPKITHFYTLLGIYWAIDNKKVIDVSAWSRAIKDAPWQWPVNGKYQWSVNGRYQYSFEHPLLEAAWLGGGVIAGADNTPAFMVELGFTFPTFGGFMKLGYGYTCANVFDQSALGNAHEFNLSFSRKCPKKR